MSALSTRNDPIRRLRSFWRHTTQTFQSLVFALEAVIIWGPAREAGLHFLREDDPYLFCAFGGFFFVWSTMAGWLFIKVDGKKAKLVQAVLTQDEHTFMIYRDERLAIAMHMFLGFISGSLLILIAGMDYHSKVLGVTLVFILTFCLSFYWIFITKLDDPTLSPWFLERIPKHWLTQSVDVYFRLTEQSEEVPETPIPQPLNTPSTAK